MFGSVCLSASKVVGNSVAEINMVKMGAREKFDCDVYMRGGSSFVHRKPEFSHDSKLVMVCSGSSVRVLSVGSGECVHTLHGHQKLITGVRLNPHNPYQVLTSSLDKTIIKWEYRDGLFVKRYKLDGAVHALYTAQKGQEHSLFAVRENPKTASSHDLVSIKIPKQGQKVDYQVLIRHVKPKEQCVSVSAEGDFVAAISSRNLTVCHTRKENTKIWKLEELHQWSDNKLTCVACHPREHAVATGVSDGRILIWYNIFKKHVVSSVNHWHSLRVWHLSFTLEGSYLLSGGHECVLVKWQWNGNNKDFLPRLGSPIISITCASDNSHYALCHADNGIQIVSSNFKLIQTYQGLTEAYLDYSKKDGLLTGLHRDPHTGALVTNGKPGHLQFYDVHRDKQLFNLDVLGQNFISPENLRTPHAVTKVECVAFSTTGDWLATVERWDDGEMTPEIRLKFWALDKQTQGYKLNTLVNDPHRKAIHALVFRPSQKYDDRVAMVISASQDGTFKIWTLVDDTDIYRSNHCWSCESVGFYRKQTPGPLAVSVDGTLLAVAFDNCLTFWDPETNALQNTLDLPQTESNIRHILFGSEESSHYLMATTLDRLYVWNLLTCSVCWSFPVSVSALVSCPGLDLFAVFAKNQQVYVFSPQCSQPVFSHREVSATPIKSAIFLPTNTSEMKRKSGGRQLLPWQHSAELFYMNEDHVLLTLDTRQHQKPESSKTVLVQNLPETPMSLLLSNKRKTGLGEFTPQLVQAETEEPGKLFINEILNTPAHVLPPVSSLAMNMLDSMLKHMTIPKKHRAALNDGDDSDNDSDDPRSVASDSDSDMEVQEDVNKPSSCQQESAPPQIESENHSDDARHAEYAKYSGNSTAHELFGWLS